MPRKAASPEEIDQVGRVHRLLVDAGVVPAREVVVTFTSRDKITGRLVKHLVGNKADGMCKPRCYFGMLTLATQSGEVDIDYLDVVWLQAAEAPKRSAQLAGAAIEPKE